MRGRTPHAGGRTGRPGLFPGLRWLLVALTLLAAAAFQTRAGGGGPRPVLAGASAHGHAAPHPGHPRPGPAITDHGAHCLFCLTGAFALQPEAWALSAAPPWPAPAAPARRPWADVAVLRHTDARAPPCTVPEQA